MEIPGRAPLDSNHGRPFLLTSFWLADDARKPDLAQELKDYWTQELAVKLGRPVEALEVAIPGEDLFRQADFWKQLAGSVPGSVILTGRVAFTQETRKAIAEKEKGSIQEPFVREKVWETRLNSTLESHFFLIDGRTGNVIRDWTYKEAATSANTKTPPVFALYELLQRTKIRFFRDAFGAPRNQERYLLRD